MYLTRLPAIFPEGLIFLRGPLSYLLPCLCLRFTREITIALNTYYTPANVICAINTRRAQALYWPDTAGSQDLSWPELDLFCSGICAELRDRCPHCSSSSSGDGPSREGVTPTPNHCQTNHSPLWQPGRSMLRYGNTWEKPKQTQKMRRKKPPPSASWCSSQRRHGNANGLPQPIPHFA